MIAPISTIRVLACRDTLAAVLATRYATLAPIEPEAPDSIVDRDKLPSSIHVLEWTSTPRVALPIEAEHLPALHETVRQMAWRSGAWDLSTSLLPALIGPDLGLVSANTDWTACEHGTEAALLRAAGGGRLAMWLWRPMYRAPATRSKAHAERDTTLLADGSRAGQPPAAERQPAWTRPTWSRVERLGAAVAPSPGPRATARQRAAIISLRRQAGLSGPSLPSSLTRGEASRIISTLLARRA